MSNNIGKNDIIIELQNEFDKEIKEIDKDKFQELLAKWEKLYHNTNLGLEDYTNRQENSEKNLAKFLLYYPDSNKFFGSAKPTGNNYKTMLYANKNGTYSILEKNKEATQEQAENYYKKYIYPLFEKADNVKSYEDFKNLEIDKNYENHKHNMMLRKIVVINSLLKQNEGSDLYCNLIPLYSEECLKNICDYLSITCDRSLVEPMKEIADWCFGNLKIEKNPISIVVLGHVLYNKHSGDRVVYLPYDSKKSGKIKVNNNVCEYTTGNNPKDLMENDKFVYVADKQASIVYQGVITDVNKQKEDVYNVVVKLKKESKEISSFQKILNVGNSRTEQNIYKIKCYKELESYFDNLGKDINMQDDCVVLTERESNNKLQTEMMSVNPTAYNKIFYGVPGCGKSYHIEHDVLGEIFNDKDYIENKTKYSHNVFRTIFYQDYSHADFVGQYMPKRVNGQVEYVFVPKVFTKALERAYQKPEEPVVLIIEEINRGDAASIFGDIFQLLDRNNGGRSEYEIDCDEIVDYLSNVKNRNETITNIVGENEKEGTNKIYIPSNLYLLATMNTCDQNVFALDTAFKRRWNMKEIPNEFKEEYKIKDKRVPCNFDGKYITWEKFVKVVNEQIVDSSDEFFGDDRQIGCFFVDDTCLLLKDETANESKSRNFAYKVISYLWNDVAKLNRNKWFVDDVKTLHDAIAKFVDNKDVFSSVLKTELLKDESQSNTSQAEADENESTEE